MKIILFFYFLFISVLYSQDKFDYKVERNRFNISLIDKQKRNIIYTRKINKNEKFEGRYLGKVKSIAGVNYFLVVSSYIFDLNVLAKTENHIFIYNSNRQLLGYYYLSQMYELPKNLKKNKLYFRNNECKEENVVNFDKGIPNAINLKCNGENNFYEFQD